MKKLPLFIVTVLMFFSPFLKSLSVAQEEGGVQRLLLGLKPAVVFIYVNIKGWVNINGREYQPDQVNGFGSGFIVNPDGYLITNGHVVDNYNASNETRLEGDFIWSTVLKFLIPEEEARQGRRFSDQEKRTIAIELYNQLYSKAQVTIKKDLLVFLSNGEHYPAEIKAFSPPLSQLPGKVSYPGASEKVETGKDVAVLKIEGRNLPTVPLGDSANLQLGEPIYVIGFPGVVFDQAYLSQKTQLDATVSSGQVSGAKLDVKGTPVIQTDAPVTWGNSGGPAFNAKGEVIGIPTFISISQSTGTPQAIQGFNFLVPVNTAKEFVRTSGVDLAQPSLFNKLWYEALGLYAKGQYRETLAKLDEVMRILPNQPDARKLQVASQERIANQPQQSGGKSMVKVAAPILLMIVVVAVLAYVAQSRKKSKGGEYQPSAAETTAPSKTYKAAGLLISEGGKSHQITGSGIKIGRDPNKNQIVIDNDGVSREHAWVGAEGGGVVVRDLNSLNGTYINSTAGNRVKSEPLREGDVVIIGKGKFASFTYKSS
ncbi:MAG: trypsin-like peptidase domain-containing protein [Deltaproteobacteria bacterium]